MNQSNMSESNVVTPDKSVLIILDGLGDLPIAELNGNTPLEAANTPVLDRLASSGKYGLVDPIAAGVIPNTHSGTGLLMGLLPDQIDRLNRGPVEAAGAGRVLKTGEIAMRVNFATMQHSDDGFLVTDRRAGRITSGTKQLAAVLADIDLGNGVHGSLLSTDQHRGVLVLSGAGLDASISDTDPGSGRMPTMMKACRALKPTAKLTASKVNAFIAEAFRRLTDHPINIARIHDGQLPANGLLTRGAGAHFELDNILNGLGIKAAVVTGCNTVRGLGRIFGFNAIMDSRFTATVETDLQAKIAAVKSALRDHDMVFVHMKAPDICSHDRQPLAKRDFLQRLDRALEPMLETGSVFAVAADHTTDSNSGFHTADPVPTLICPANPKQPVTTIKFGENQCRNGTVGRRLSSVFLLDVVRNMGYTVA